MSKVIRADANGVRVVKDLELTAEVRRMVELWGVCADVREHTVVSGRMPGRSVDRVIGEAVEGKSGRTCALA